MGFEKLDRVGRGRKPYQSRAGASRLIRPSTALRIARPSRRATCVVIFIRALATRLALPGLRIEPRQVRLEYGGSAQLHPQRWSGVFSQRSPMPMRSPRSDNRVSDHTFSTVSSIAAELPKPFRRQGSGSASEQHRSARDRDPSTGARPKELSQGSIHGLGGPLCRSGAAGVEWP
jgi:hypothetical protein